jgi:hypothetical protein
MTEDKTGKMKSEVGVAKKSPPTLTIDWELYGQYLEDSDLSDAEKRQFLEALWSIVVSFVDLGFGVHPVQQATGDSCENSCEQDAEIRTFIADERASVVGSADTGIIQNDVADGQSNPSQERRTK